jgi:hypothetical protein
VASSSDETIVVENPTTEQRTSTLRRRRHWPPCPLGADDGGRARRVPAPHPGTREIEDFISADPSVAAVAVIGVPDPTWGEAVKAVIVAAEGATPDINRLIRRVRDLKMRRARSQVHRSDRRAPVDRDGEARQEAAQGALLEGPATRGRMTATPPTRPAAGDA